MTTLRRILTGAAFAFVASGLASADIIPTLSFGGCVAVAGGQNCSVKETGALSAVNFNIVSPTSLFDFDNFGNLGITGTLTSASFDYEYHNYLSHLSVQNNDTLNGINVDVKVTTAATLDPASTMPNGNKNSLRTELGVGTTTSNSSSVTVADTGDIGIDAGGFYNFADTHSLPIVYTNGYSWNFGCNPGDPVFGGGDCFGDPSNSLALTIGGYTGSGIFKVGTTDQAAFSVGSTGNSGNANVTVIFTTTYDAEAEVTYNYFVPDAPSTPEPATMALMGGALLGLGLLGRRLKR